MLTEAQQLDAIIALIVDEPVNWDSVFEPASLRGALQLARQHGVETLLIDSMMQAGQWQTLPVEQRETLASRVKHAAAFQLGRAQDLVTVAAAIEAAGSRLLVLKGGGLAASHYERPYLRDRADTDIFIPLQHIDAVRATFVALGYRSQGFVYKSHQFSFTSDRFGGGSIHYDVHWRISNNPQYSRVLSYAEVNAAAVPVPGLPGVWGMQPVHALLLACMHRAGNPDHNPNRLVWLYDIHLLAGGFSAAQWAELCELALGRGVQRACLQALEKSVETFGTDLPQAVMAALSNAPATNTFLVRFKLSQLGLIVDDLRQLPNYASRCRMLGEYLFPPADYLLQRYEKSARLWLPALYCRYLLGGLVARLSLR